MPPKLRRPAAVVPHPKRRGALRRPAALGDAEEGINSGEVTLELCRGLRDIEVVTGTYWDAPVKAALRVKEVQIREGELFLKTQVLGTQLEELLQVASNRGDRVIEVHLCPDTCPGTPHTEGLLHVKRFRQLGDQREAWMTNMVPGPPPAEEADELADLRADKARVGIRPGQDLRGPRSESPAREKKEGKRKRRSSSRKKRRKELRVECQKEVKALFAHTGADPEPGVRKRFKKKAARLARTKFKSSSSASSSSSSSSIHQVSGDPSIFGSTGKVQVIGKRLPGTLMASALEEASENLVTSEGGLWETSTGCLPPLFVRYYKQQLAPRMPPAMSRETHTLCQALDLLLRARPAEAGDLLSQRVKALEMQSSGVHFTVSQQQELLPREGVSMSSTPEFQEAARRAREEGKARADAARPYGVKAPAQSKGEEWQKGAGKKGYQKGKGFKGDTKKSEAAKGEDKKGKGS